MYQHRTQTNTLAEMGGEENIADTLARSNVFTQG
jgi:hypothetical protein